jgi:hypothetical protein
LVASIARGIKDRCKAELNLLTRIEKTPMESRDRCELVWRILSENSIEAIDETLKKLDDGDFLRGPFAALLVRIAALSCFAVAPLRFAADAASQGYSAQRLGPGSPGCRHT